jgi:hypothetical protein
LLCRRLDLGVGYNIQVAVDAKNKLIVEQAVTNQVVDLGLLTQTAEPAREVLGVETMRRNGRTWRSRRGLAARILMIGGAGLHAASAQGP